jgi:hypothetical protein
LKGKKENVITFAKSVRILRVMACYKALLISHPPKQFQKIQLQIGILVVCPKSLNSIYGTHSPLGVNFFNLSMVELKINYYGVSKWDCVKKLDKQ